MTPGEAGPCPDRETLAAWLDGRLAAEARDDIEGHLAACPTCLDLVVQTRALIESRQVSVPMPPPTLVAAASELVTPSLARRRWRGPLGWPAAAAAAIAVSMAGYGAGTASGPECPADPASEVLMDEFLAFESLEAELDGAWLLDGELTP